MKNIIKQIEKIKGVVTVEKAGENMAVVVFEGRPKPKLPEWAGREYVKCTTEVEYEFVKKQNGLNGYDPFEAWLKYPCVCVNGTDIFSSEALPERAHRVIDFDRYLLFFGLRDKWNEANKPKSLSPDELVDGRIYVSEDNDCTFVMTYRYKSFGTQRVGGFTVNNYSCMVNSDKPSFNYWCEASAKKRTCRPATPSEAQSLIRAEIANGYFHELKDAK